MQARFRKNGDVTIVQLLGTIDFGAAIKFKQDCVPELVDKQVVFNFEGLHFVGSCGITDFINAVGEVFTRSQVTPKLCGVSTEFQKIIESSVIGNVEFYKSELSAIKSFVFYSINYDNDPMSKLSSSSLPFAKSPNSGTEPLGKPILEEDLQKLKNTDLKLNPSNYPYKE